MKKDPPTEIRSLSFYRQTATGGREKVEMPPEAQRRALGDMWLRVLCGLSDHADPIMRNFSGLADPKRVVYEGFIDGAGTLQNLLAPIAALWILCGGETFKGKSVSEWWREKLETSLLASAIIREDPFLSQERKGSLAEHLQQFEKDLEWRIQRAEAAEKNLLTSGWRFDSMTGRATMIRGGRGRDFLRECVWAIYTAKHREEYLDAADAKKLSIRRKIATVLAPYFDAAELSPESGALIYDAIDKGEKRR